MRKRERIALAKRELKRVAKCSKLLEEPYKETWCEIPCGVIECKNCPASPDGYGCSVSNYKAGDVPRFHIRKGVVEIREGLKLREQQLNKWL